MKEAVNLLKNEQIFHKEKIETIRGVIKLEIDNLLDEENRKEFKGEIELTDETAKLFKESFDYMNTKFKLPRLL